MQENESKHFSIFIYYIFFQLLSSELLLPYSPSLYSLSIFTFTLFFPILLKINSHHDCHHQHESHLWISTLCKEPSRQFVNKLRISTRKHTAQASLVRLQAFGNSCFIFSFNSSRDCQSQVKIGWLCSSCQKPYS